MNIYQNLIRPLLFSGLKADPEYLHHQVIDLLQWFNNNSQNPLVTGLLNYAETSFCWEDSRFEQTLWGLKFPNPIGLGAGFDKDGVGARIWSYLGFGYVELGTVTHHPQPGNPSPRLFRLEGDRAILNRMGFNNQGSLALSQRLKNDYPYAKIPLGINLGKSKITPLEAAAGDYQESFKILKPWGDYFVINVSSPNTPGLRSLQEGKQLSLILDGIQQENQGEKPILVKIAPDLEKEAIEAVINLALEYQLGGIIATNTTLQKDNLKTKIILKTGNPVSEEAGGISGQPLRDKATEIIRFIYQKTEGKLPIIGVGGIFTVDDAWAKIAAGASLIQVYTGLVYEGPWLLRSLLQGIGERLTREGYQGISEVIGSQS